ncbi:hypothetical protein IQ13_2232 [Lacibacter cauensis]|uniref:Uncharacterized protein n=1 Tax=Lacibacter cauensis TaxID=510947 RepID=A0A562SK51_9BACT|nr:hypothetical protein [Lacibacter cauensis]TWI81216.1 hypothetical protein IQ13_2232 [Lacibacter cauensis]
MQQLLRDIEQVVDLSTSETKELIEAFKRFTDRHFDIDPVVLQQTFSYSAAHLLNQQEDEDNSHAELEELLLY